MKLNLKIMVPPAVTIVFLLLFGLLALGALKTQGNALNEIFGERLGAFRSAVSIARELDRAHTGTYRLLTWMGTYSEDKIKAASAEIFNGIDASMRDVQNLQQSASIAESDRTGLAAIAEHLKKYRKNTAQAIDLASADVNMGVAMMQTADTTYIEVEKALDGFIQHNQELAGASYENARGRLGQVQMAAIVVLVLAFAVAAAVSFGLRRQIMNPLRQAQAFAAAIASGDLTPEVHSNARDEIGDLMRSLETMRGSLRTMIGAVKNSASQVGRSTGAVAASANQVAAASESQSDNASSMAAAIEELTASIHQMADSASQAHQLSVASGEVSRRGSEVIQSTLKEMNEIASTVTAAAGTIDGLGQQSKQISAVVDVIKDIAEQTNLLALNAAIEAARAGEQGRGFAVVADEVRKLAERTALSTEDIRGMVANIQSGAETAVREMEQAVTVARAGVELAGQAGESTLQITQRTGATAQEVNAISAALKEQRVAGDEIARRVEQIAQMTEQNRGAAQDSASSARQLQGLAESMLHQVSQFKV
ncbi:MAG: methyl-accepting chemotaxis protein [Rhodocyclaceae bacterium]